MKKFLIQFHRLFGTLLSVLFLVWFLSGFVMIYKHFPTLKTKKYNHLVSLPDTLPNINRVESIIPKDESIKSFTIEMFRKKPVWKIQTSEKRYLLSADSLLSPLEYGVPFLEIKQFAEEWNNSPIKKVDTLQTLDQWIPYSKYKKELPIYKFQFDDTEKSYLYVSSVTGKVLQYVTREQRFWSWLGPIPHLLYFWKLRQNRDQWITVITWLAGLGTLMCLAGIILGIWRFTIVFRRKRKFRSLYKTFYLKWHHILGFFFGFFVFMFILSGMMSLNDLPNWVVNTKNRSIEKKLKKKSALNLSKFEIDYRDIIKKYKNQVKEISFNQYGEKPYYSVVIDKKSQNFDAESQSVEPLFLQEQEVLSQLNKVTQAPKTISLMTEFDNYYVGFTKRMVLPVYKVVANDEDKHVFYVNPETGYTRFYNKNKRFKKWIYPAFHSLRFKFFVEHRILRDIVLWFLMIGGTLVSFTGVVIAYKYLKRKYRRSKKRRKRKRSH